VTSFGSAFDSPTCTIYSAWGKVLQRAYPTFESACKDCTTYEWRDPTTRVCAES
jgi:hypothetical protein